MSKKNPIVAIIGRTNVGKSSLFNRLVERRKAIISDLPATTRDRNYSTVYWKGEKFTIIDSGGLDIKKGEAIEEDIRKQAEIAAQEADLILLLTDGKKTVTPKDKEIARWLKKIKQPKILVVNKVDNLKIRNRLESDFFKLGLGKPFLISALNGSGSGDLLDEIADKLPKFSSADKEPDLRIAVVGKTNVGKSSFVNALLGEERVIVPSPQIPAYDAKPEMSAPEVAGRIIKDIDSDAYDFIVVNFANPDMVAHTGNLKATIKSIEIVDDLVGQIVNKTLAKGGVVLITADHGNAEDLVNLQTGGIVKEHSTNPVPLYIIGEQFAGKVAAGSAGKDLSDLTPAGVLADVAPTILKIMGLKRPDEMTGRPLI